MSKKVVLIIVGVFLLGGISIGAFFLFKSKKGQPAPADVQTGFSVNYLAEEATPDVLYEDPSGFSIKHPESITVEDITPEDEIFYAMLSLTRGDESIVIVFKDTEYKSVEDMLEGEEDAPKNAELVGATSMAEIPMSQYSYLLEGKETLLTAGIDQDVLYLIEGPKDGSFWEEAQNLLVSTFTFSTPETQASNGGGEAIIYEAEEVIE